MKLIQLLLPVLVVLPALLPGQTTGTVHRNDSPTSAPSASKVRFTYDMVASDQDATSDSLDVASSISSDTERMNWLATASINENYTETTGGKINSFPGMSPGNQGDEGFRRGDRNGGRYTPTLQAYGGHLPFRPSGPLAGKIIFASAGHGWTNDNTSTSLWYTQRPSTFNVVEDMGNLDQMNLYADLCFRAGATIVPLRPVGFQHIERIIDNASEQALFHGQWMDSQSTASFNFGRGSEVPYRYATASSEETAVARFMPVIPVTDVYPVYTWVRSGADRINQTYRIVHAGGALEIDVDHRKVGNGWVYLGSYTFQAGSAGYVEVTNKSRDGQTSGVVIADAIRFGNGMGDVNRGGGISGSPREEEASRYWIQRSLAAGYPPIYDAFPDREDQSNNVGAAPRFAAHMNRETEGGFFDRLFLSFHSNASGGRGVVGLFNAHQVMRPDYQIELAKLTADELNAEMTSSGISLSQPWFVRRVRTDAHINFGEIRRDYLNNEMSATIVEVAYHDSEQDAELLRKYSVRQAIAQSAYRATLRYFGEVGQQQIPIISPPARPVLSSAKAGKIPHSIEIRWTPATEDPLSSSAGTINYRLYQSLDGVVFDSGVDVGAGNHYTVNKIKDNQPHYYRLTAISKGGESLPSAVFGTSLGVGPKVLIVNGSPALADDSVLTRTVEANLGQATGSGGSFVRIVPRLMNNFEQTRAIGDGVHTLKFAFDTVAASGLTSEAVVLANYQAITLSMGRHAINESLTTTETLSWLAGYVNEGGHLLVTGANLAEVDTATTDSLERWGEFMAKITETGFDSLTTQTQVIKAGDNSITTTTLNLGNRLQRYFEPRGNEALQAKANGRRVLEYPQGQAAAVATLKDRVMRTAVIGLPIEELDGREEQSILVAQVLTAMGLQVHKAAALTTTSQETTTSSVAVTTSTLENRDAPTTGIESVTITTVTLSRANPEIVPNDPIHIGPIISKESPQHNSSASEPRVVIEDARPLATPAPGTS